MNEWEFANTLPEGRRIEFLNRRMLRNSSSLYWARYWPSKPKLEQDTIFLVAIVFAAMVFTVIAEFGRTFSHVFWIPILMDLFLYMPVRIALEPRLRGSFWTRVSPILTNPCTFVWFLAFFLPHLIYQQFGANPWVAYFMCLVAWRIANLCKAIAHHYTMYAVEHHSVDEYAHDNWKKRIADSSSNSEVVPQVPLLFSTPRHALGWALFSYRRKAFLLIVISCGFAAAHALPSPPPTSLSLSVPFRGRFLFVAVPCLIATLFVLLSCRCWPALLKPLLVFLHSPTATKDELPKRWGPESPRGSTHDRRTFFFVNALVIFLCLLHPFCTALAPDVDTFALHGFVEPVTETFIDVSQISIVYWAASLIALPALLLVALLGIVGPSAAAANRLFEDDDALEHFGRSEVDDVRV